ncbi:MAG: hypothetical protein ACK4N5_09660, partial [Myxococcales bacterium]
PGHAAGQLGLLARTDRGEVFLVGDAAWTSRSFRELRPPSRLAGLIFDDFAEAGRTLAALHALAKERPALKIVPSHCREVPLGVL